MSDNNLVNLGELSKPATTLVEKISDAVGGVFKPYQIRRVARAEADAERIRAVAQIEVSDLQRRAVQRWLTEEAKKQDNIETITSKALPDVKEDAEPDRVENDWITNFFDKARLISDEEMQAFWAKVLAGEANDPGTYSKRTVNYLASLDAEDARLFTALIGFCWDIGYLQPVIFDTKNPLYTEAGLTFATLTHLDDIGLIRFDSQADFQVSGPQKRSVVSYFGQRVELEFGADRKHELPLGRAIMSKVGRELAPLCSAKPVDGFFGYVVEKWTQERIVVLPAAVPGSERAE